MAPKLASGPTRVRITKPRFFQGTYIHASVEAPATFTIPDGHKIDDGMEELEGTTDAPVPKLKPPHVEKVSHPQSVLTETTQPESKQDQAKHGKKKDVI